WDSTHARIPQFFDNCSMNRVRQRLRCLSHEDLNRQLWFIRASFTTLARDIDRNRIVARGIDEPPTTPDRQTLLETAVRVAQRLEELALRDGNSIAWIGLTLTHERHWSIL